MMKFLPWKKKTEEPELDALLDSSPVLGDVAFDDDSNRTSEEEELLNQYLNSDADSDDINLPSAGSILDSSAGAVLASETQQLPATLPSGGSDDDPDDDDGSVGFQLPIDQDGDEDGDGNDDEDISDDVMSIFEEEEEVDEDLAALTQGLMDIDAAELLAEARSIARKLATLTSGKRS